MLLPYATFLGLDPGPSWERRVKKVRKNKHDKNPKKREQFEPNDSLRIIHAYAEAQIRQKLDNANIHFPSATAFVKGESGIDKHLARHTNKEGYFHQYWFVTDLKSAYLGVSIDVLASLLFRLFPVNLNPYDRFTNSWDAIQQIFDVDNPGKVLQFEHEDIRVYLEKFFAHPIKKDGLCEGFPASPFLFNLYCELLIDRKLRSLCRRYKITYSRFADDLIFTSDTPIGKVKSKKIKKLITEWFPINIHKTHHFDINDYPQGVPLNGCLIRNNDGQGEIMPLGRRKREFRRLAYAAYYYPNNIHHESLLGKHGVIQQRMLGVGRGGTNPSRGLRKALHYFKFYLNIKNTDRLIGPA